MDCFQLMPALKWYKCFMTGSYETVNYVKIFLFRKGEGNLESFSNIIKMNLFFFCGSKSEQQAANADLCDVEE